MEISENDLAFTNSFENYKTKFDELKELSEGEFPKSLRLFDIRLRLALSLQIGFDNTISYTKTETTRKTYNLILRLNDLWFAYEGLYKLCSENSYLKSSPTKSDPFTVDKITELLGFYKQFCTDLQHDKNGWYLQFTYDSYKKYFLEKLLLHEIGHCVDYIYQRHWSKANNRQVEDFADNYAVIWSNNIKQQLNKKLNKKSQQPTSV